MEITSLGTQAAQFLVSCGQQRSCHQTFMKGETDDHGETGKPASSQGVTRACMWVGLCACHPGTEGQSSWTEITSSVVFLPPGCLGLQWKQEQTFLSTYCALRAFSAPLPRGPGRQLSGAGEQLPYCPGDSETSLAGPRSHSWWMRGWPWDLDIGPSSKNQRLPSQFSLPSRQDASLRI